MELIQELLVRNALIASLFLLAITSQWAFYKRTNDSFLRLGTMALAFGLLAELTRSLGDAYLPVVLPVYQITESLFCLFIYAALVKVVDSKVSLPLLGATAAAAILLSVGFALAGASPGVSTVSLVPGAALLLYGLFQLVSSGETSPGRFFISLMICLHIMFSLVTPFVAGSPLGEMLNAYLNAIIVLITGSALPLIAAEKIVNNLHLQEQKLGRVVQENRRLEVQVTQAQKHESLGMLAGGIAHDFNNMLTSILGYTSLAINKLSPDSEVRKDLYMVMSGARQAVELTSQMLAYAGKSAIEFEPVNLSTAIDDLSELISSIVPKRIRLVSDLAEGLPLVHSDPVQVSQMVMNLVANAVDAIAQQDGVIEISTGLADVSEDQMKGCWFAEEHGPGAFVYLRVQDNGAGFDQAHAGRIFDPFYSEKSQGRGLGLSSLSGIVRQHKGFIDVTTSPGEGSIFTLYFPVIAFRDGESLPAGTLSPARGVARPSVLVADDDPRIRSLIVSLLSGEGFDVVGVSDGREAVDTALAGEQHFDLLLLDCTMPKKSGPQVYREVRQSGSQIPVLLVSGFQQEQVLTDVSADENAGFMKKPFNIDELTDRVRSLIAQARTESYPGH